MQNHSKTYCPAWMSPNQKTGFMAEIWVKEQLEQLGYDVQVKPNWTAKCCDLVVNGVLAVEVKESNHRKRRYVSRDGVISEYDWFSADVRSVDMADRVVVFIAKDDKGQRFAYVVPGPIAGQRSSLAISSHPTRYKGFLSSFLENWAVVDFFLNKRYQQEGQLML